MPKYPFLIVADAHLNTGPKQYDAEFALKQAGQVAVENQVEAILFLGDTLDKQRNRSRPITQIYRFIENMRRKKIGFRYLTGQHDADDPPWFDGLDHAVHMHKQLEEIDGISFYGLDYQPIGKLQEELDLVPKNTDMLLTHQVWADWMGDVAAPQGEFADVPHVSTLISGDFHQYVQETRRGKDGQKIQVCSPGCTYQQAIDQPSEHFVVLVSSALKLEPVKLDSRVFIDWQHIHTEEDLESFIKGFDLELDKARETAEKRKLPERLRRPLLRVVYSAAIPDALRRIERVVQGRAWTFDKEIPTEARSRKITRKAGKAETVTPLSVLPDEVDPKEEPEVFNLVQRLLEATDVDQELAAWRAEQLEV